MSLIQRVLCPVDFSETSHKAFEFAQRLAQASGAELLLLHVFDVPATLGLVGQEHPSDPTLAERLDAVRPSLAGLKVDRVLHAGPPADVICWMAQHRGCDMIVMGTHGRGGVAHLLMGSVAEHVMRSARCPVVTVRNRPPDEPPLPEPRVLPVPPPRFM